MRLISLILMVFCLCQLAACGTGMAVGFGSRGAGVAFYGDTTDFYGPAAAYFTDDPPRPRGYWEQGSVVPQGAPPAAVSPPSRQSAHAFSATPGSPPPPERAPDGSGPAGLFPPTPSSVPSFRQSADHLPMAVLSRRAWARQGAVYAGPFAGREER